MFKKLLLFTTIILVFIVNKSIAGQPSVDDTNCTPKEGVTGVSVNIDQITIVFSESIYDPTPSDSATFEIKDATNNLIDASNYQLDYKTSFPNQIVITFQNTALPLDWETKYTVTISRVKSKSTQEIANGLKYSFTTGFPPWRAFVKRAYL